MMATMRNLVNLGVQTTMSTMEPPMMSDHWRLRSRGVRVVRVHVSPYRMGVGAARFSSENERLTC